MDKSRVISVLVAYSPPLSMSQMEAIADEISKILETEKAEAKPKRRAP